jgi:hypothetical protein
VKSTSNRKSKKGHKNRLLILSTVSATDGDDLETDLLELVLVDDVTSIEEEGTVLI